MSDVTTIRYQEIADELRERVRAAPAGSVLPSESELSAEFGASRVTVRRALELRARRGLIAARQGSGGSSPPSRCASGSSTLGTIEAQLEGSGHARRAPGHRVRVRDAAGPRARDARPRPTEQVLRVKRINLADGEPFAVVTVWCPAALGGALSRERRRAPAVLRAARRRSCAARRRRSVPTPPSRPTRRCSACRSARRCCAAERVTTESTGRPVLVSEHLFPAHRTEFVVELPQRRAVDAPDRPAPRRGAGSGSVAEVRWSSAGPNWMRSTRHERTALRDAPHASDRGRAADRRS